MIRLRIIYKFIIHFFSANNTGGFGVHSPFLFQFTRFVLFENKQYYFFTQIEQLRKQLKNDKRVLAITDFGTGYDRRATVAAIASHSLKSARHGQLLFRIANYFKVNTVLELGTSLGITTSYLASSSKKIQCISMEGCPQIAAVATENFKSLGLNNIEVIVGNIDETLDVALGKFNHFDLIFIDANHQFTPVMSYFDKCLHKMNNNSILIVDDIYWSKEMERVWKSIKNHQNVTSTIDLFHFGIVFLNSNLKKKHYKMRY
jgi:predicted O-methyltransferase YrrM